MRTFTFDVSGAGTPLPLYQTFLPRRSLPPSGLFWKYEFCDPGHNTVIERMLLPAGLFAGVQIVCIEFAVIKKFISKKLLCLLQGKLKFLACLQNTCQAFFEKSSKD